MTHPDEQPGQHPDLPLVLEALAFVAHIKSTREAARILGISEPRVRAWRKGKYGFPLRGTRSALERSLRRLRAQKLSVREARAPYGKPTDTSDDADRMPLDLNDKKRLVAAIARLGPPGQRTARKLDVLDGLQVAFAGLEIPIPDWFYETRRKIERGEL